MLSFVKVKIINKLANLTLKLKDVEKNSEAGSFHSNQKYDLTPPMQKIGIGLMEVADLINKLGNEEYIDNGLKEKLDEVFLKVDMLRGMVKEWMSDSQTDSGHRANPLTEKERVEVADEMHKRKFLAKIDKVIIEGMEERSIDIQYLTDRLCMSRSTLYRRVKSLTGVSANEYIRRKRMEIAKELLIDGDIPVSEIAFKVGCSSMSYFRQSFKDIYGVIPSEYLRKLKSN